MDFGKKQLAKFGWKDGDGLGKNNQGMVSCIKPKLKFDNNGLGYNRAEEFNNHWWENVYKKASSNIIIEKDSDNKITMNLIDPDGVEITNKTYTKKSIQSKESKEYKNFIRKAKLSNNMEDHEAVKIPDVKEISPCNPEFTAISDEALYKACGGRTAHKGARHGLTMSGKLARLAAQEEMLLKKLKEQQKITQDAGDSLITIKKKKKKKSRETNYGK